MSEQASARQYLVIDEKGKGHLPVRDSPDGPLNHHLMGAAWAALHSGHRGKKYEGPGKAEAIAKLKGLYKAEGMDLPDTNSEVLSVKDGSDSSSFALDTSSFTLHPSHFSEPRFVVLLAEPPATGLIRIPIAVTGSWAGAEKKFSIELDDLNEIRGNFAKKPTGEINVDYEHASEVPFGTGGPVLSAGRIVKLTSRNRSKTAVTPAQAGVHRRAKWIPPDLIGTGMTAMAIGNSSCGAGTNQRSERVRSFRTGSTGISAPPFAGEQKTR